MTNKEAFDSFCRRTDRSVYPVRHDKRGFDEWALVCTWLVALVDGIEKATTDDDLDAAIEECRQRFDDGTVPDQMTRNLLMERLANELMPDIGRLPSMN